jgi:WS/DGAT/MGAT family acyltransferase
MDLSFYLMETHDNPKHVGALQIFQLPPDAGEGYLLDLVDNLRQLPVLEPFNFKPVFPRVGRPQWHSDEKMEMEYHLRHSALPRPGNMEQLLAVAQRLHAGILDRERPGWICQVIEGLEGNRFGIYIKIHHAYIDGMSAVHRIFGSLSPDPDSAKVDAFWSYQGPADERPAKKEEKKSAAGRLRDAGNATRAQLKAFSELNAQLLKVGLELAKLRKHTGHIPFNAPRNKLNDPVRTDLRSLGVTTMPLDRLKQIGRKADCTLNDTVLTIIDAALHDYLARHNDNADKPLVAMCPMALRDPNDATANTQVTILAIELGQPDVGLRERLAQVVNSTTSAKDDARKLSKETLMDYFMFLGGVLEILQRTGLDQIVPHSGNLLVSNVPGPDSENLFMKGSRLEAIYPLTTLGGGTSLMITLVTHGNSLDLGMVGAHGSLPDIEYLVERLDHQFAALCSEFGVTATTTRKPRAKRKTASKAKTKARSKTKVKSKTRAR